MGIGLYSLKTPLTLIKSIWRNVLYRKPFHLLFYVVFWCFTLLGYVISLFHNFYCEARCDFHPWKILYKYIFLTNLITQPPSTKPQNTAFTKFNKEPCFTALPLSQAEKVLLHRMQRINCKIYGQTDSKVNQLLHNQGFFLFFLFLFLHFCYLRTTQYYSMKDNRETQQKVPKGGILITLSLDSSSTTSIISRMST